MKRYSKLLVLLSSALIAASAMSACSNSAPRGVQTAATSEADYKYQLSTHIIDTDRGRPAANVAVRLEKQDGTSWKMVEEKVTDANGRIGDFLEKEDNGNLGTYRLTFFTAQYFQSVNQFTFYPYVEVTFQITDASHYHVPIAISPYAYSTYRGN